MIFRDTAYALNGFDIQRGCLLATSVEDMELMLILRFRGGLDVDLALEERNVSLMKLP